MHNLAHQWKLKLAVCLGISIASTGVAAAQALASAQRGAEIAPFAQTTMINPDWGTTNNFGFSAGVDYTRLIQSIVQPSLELRVTSAGGQTVTERTYSGGLKLATNVRSVHPYATVLAGYGTINFAHPTMSADGLYASDNSRVFTIGVGAAVDVRTQWQVQLEFMQQLWNLPLPLSPTAVSLGVSYRIPFHNGRIQ